MNPQPIDPPTQSTWRHVPAKTHTTIHKEFASEKQGTEWIKLVLRPSVLGLNAHTRTEAGTAAHFLTQRDPAVKEPKKKEKKLLPELAEPRSRLRQHKENGEPSGSGADLAAAENQIGKQRRRCGITGLKANPTRTSSGSKT
jgi:hypothetical protein